MALHLKVPTDAQQRLARLVAINEDGFRELVAFMQDHAQEFSSIANLREIASELKHCPEEAADVAQALMPILISHIADGERATDVASAIVASIRRTEGRSVLASQKELTLLRQRLSVLLANDQLALKAKAMSLVAERPSHLQEARIISDVRPIFGIGKGKSSAIEACSILHTLVLTCIENGEYIKHYIAVDSSDLAHIKDTVERAHAKEAALSGFLESAKVAKIVFS